jgi:phage gpG-like protein
MAIRVHFTTRGIEEYKVSLERFDLDKRDLSPLWGSISRSFVYYMRRQFASQGGEFGSPWLPVQSARYAALKAEIYPGQPTLVASGALKRSLTSQPLSVERPGPRSLELGTALPYAAIHQRGVPKGTKMSFKVGDQWITMHGLPQRTIIGSNASMRNSWRKKIQRFMVRNETSAAEEL